jgi:pyruvate-formate lyase-activating enzyme
MTSSIKPSKATEYELGRFTGGSQRPLMAMLEITNRCNMSCPLCFTDAHPKAADVGLDEIVKRLDSLLDVAGPIPLQISGGEPTLHPQLAEVVAEARRRGFRNIELVTNGMIISANPDFLSALVDQGLTAVYLQFDGLRKQTYEAIRGRDMSEVRTRSIEAIRKARICCTLAVAVTPRVNDSELGDIVDFGISNIDTVRAINFQSATRFAGRYPVQSSERGYNLEELVKLIEVQCGLVTGGFVSDLFGHPKCNAMSLVYVVDASNRCFPISHRKPGEIFWAGSRGGSCSISSGAENIFAGNTWSVPAPGNFLPKRSIFLGPSIVFSLSSRPDTSFCSRKVSWTFLPSIRPASASVATELPLQEGSTRSVPTTICIALLETESESHG